MAFFVMAFVEPGATVTIMMMNGEVEQENLRLVLDEKCI